MNTTGQPEVHLGSHIDQMKAVNQAEELQDFRREREGHLMIRDDQPFLIMSFGSKYQGVHSSKYKIEGKYHIPVGSKAIVKWDDDEIVFMTREGELTQSYYDEIVFMTREGELE